MYEITQTEEIEGAISKTIGMSKGNFGVRAYGYRQNAIVIMVDPDAEQLIQVG